MISGDSSPTERLKTGAESPRRLAYPWARRVFRPAGRWFHVPHRPIRPFAASPNRPLALSPFRSLAHIGILEVPIILDAPLAHDFSVTIY